MSNDKAAVHLPDGRTLPEGIAVRMRRPDEGPTPRQLAAVYLYATAEAEGKELPVPDVEMAASLNAVIQAAGSELIWIAEEDQAGNQIEVPDGVPPEAERVLRQSTTGIVEGLRAAGLDVDVEDAKIVDVRRISHQPDGEPTPEQDAETAGRARLWEGRYLRLAETVFHGCQRIVEGTVAGAAGPVLREVRTMASAIAEGRLVAHVDDLLRARGEEPGPPAVEREQAEVLARSILEAQIERGDASVRWEERGASKEKRIAVAETILRTARIGAAVGHSPDSSGWLNAVSGALMAEHGFDPSTASRVALIAQERLTEDGAVGAPEEASEAVSGAEAS
jgi:hypothetical protein